jgi:methyl-accepting chemotaxis protein
MPEGSSRLRSIAVRIMAIGITGALGITAIAGSAYYLGSKSSAALGAQAGARVIAAGANEVERLYAVARQDLSEFLRTRQSTPASRFEDRMKTIATQSAAVAAQPDAASVKEQLTKLGELAEAARSEIATLVARVDEVGIDQDSGLMGAAVKAGEALERNTIEAAQNAGDDAGEGNAGGTRPDTGPAWRLAADAATIRRQEFAYMASRQDALLGDVEVGVSRFERHLAANADTELKKALTEQVAQYRTAFDAWRQADTALVRSIEKLNDQLVVTTPIVAEIQDITDREVANASRDLAASEADLVRIILWIGAGVLLASVAVALMVGRSITGPLQRLRRSMQLLAEGAIDREVPETRRRDEIGDMARMVEVFRENAIERARLAATRDKEQGAQLARAATIETLVAGFRDHMGSTIRSVTNAVEELNAVSASLIRAAGTTKDQTGLASHAVDEVAVNMGMVSTGATQLTASISEIAARAAESNQVAQKALATAAGTMETMRSLESSAFAIGEVVDLIRSIAEQTNLLALNATIEAARAGDAGRGFSVVASEVKALAAQTARATDDIARQIASIQAASSEAGQALTAVNGIIADLSGLAGAVANAVEEQSAAVDSIASNVRVAADKTQAGTRAMIAVTEATRAAETVAGEVEVLSTRLGAEAADVEHRVADFIKGVKAA